MSNSSWDSLGVVGSSSATAVGAWQDASTLFVELNTVTYLAQTDPNAYCQLQGQEVDHWPLHQLSLVQGAHPSSAIDSPEQLHAEKLAGAAFKARVQWHMQALSHISNPSKHMKLMTSLHCMHFSELAFNLMAFHIIHGHCTQFDDIDTIYFHYIEFIDSAFNSLTLHFIYDVAFKSMTLHSIHPHWFELGDIAFNSFTLQPFHWHCIQFTDIASNSLTLHSIPMTLH